MIENIKVFRLNDDFYNEKFGNREQILENKNEKRPYFFTFEYNNKVICVPLRSNITTVPRKYTFEYEHSVLLNPPSRQTQRQKPGLDVTKSLVISTSELRENKLSASIDRGLFAYIRNNKEEIEQKFLLLIDNYTTEVAKNRTFSNVVRFSTLQYFHEELSLDNIINQKKYDLAVDTLIENGKTNKYNIYKENLPSEKINSLDKIEMLQSFGEYFAKISNRDFVLDVKENDNLKIILNTSDRDNKIITFDDLVDNVDYYADLYLSEHENTTENEIDI
ncbi:TPA: hypothetical protein ACU17S_002642 [Staphylococcus aureus]